MSYHGSTLRLAKKKGFFGLLADVQAHAKECPICPTEPLIVDSEQVLTDGVHLGAGDIEMLHAFAQKMGLKRSWFQDPEKDVRISYPHYDLISVNSFHRAVHAGAIYVHWRVFSEWRRS